MKRTLGKPLVLSRGLGGNLYRYIWKNSNHAAYYGISLRLSSSLGLTLDRGMRNTLCEHLKHHL